MITVGQRVKHAIDDVARGEFELALEHASIVIDITAQRHYGTTQSGRGNYKKLIVEYAWLIEMMALGGINLEESRFGNFPIDGNNEPSIADLLYHVVRCGLLHSVGIPENLRFTDQDALFIEAGRLVFPEKLIWGLLAIGVFCPANRDEVTTGGYWISIFDKKFIIDTTWGQEGLARDVALQHQMPRVTLNLAHSHFFPKN